MEDWPKSIFEILESVTDRVDEFFLEVADMVETVTNDVQTTIGVDIDQCLQDMFDVFGPISEIFADLEEIVGETEQTYYSYPIEPTLEQNPACLGCRHYHGQVYGGNLLVCGMHPYGWDTQDCPDWEAYK